MDVYAEDLAGDALEVEGECSPVLVPEVVCYTVGGDGEEAFEEEHGF